METVSITVLFYPIMMFVYPYYAFLFPNGIKIPVRNPVGLLTTKEREFEAPPEDESAPPLEKIRDSTTEWIIELLTRDAHISTAI